MDAEGRAMQEQLREQLNSKFFA